MIRKKKQHENVEKWPLKIKRLLSYAKFIIDKQFSRILQDGWTIAGWSLDLENASFESNSISICF